MLLKSGIPFGIELWRVIVILLVFRKPSVILLILPSSNFLHPLLLIVLSTSLLLVPRVGLSSFGKAPSSLVLLFSKMTMSPRLSLFPGIIMRFGSFPMYMHHVLLLVRELLFSGFEVFRCLI